MNSHINLPYGHSWLIKCLKQVKLHSSDDGVCFGTMAMGLSAFFSKDVLTFKQRLEAIYLLYKQLKEKFGEQVLAVEDKKNKLLLQCRDHAQKEFMQDYALNNQPQVGKLFAEQLNEKLKKEYFKRVYELMELEISIWSHTDQIIYHTDMLDFFRNLSINHSPEEYEELINEADIIVDLDKTFPITASKIIEEKGGIVKVPLLADSPTISGAYTIPEIKIFLSTIQTTLGQSQLDFALVHSSPNHAVMLGFEENDMTYINANTLNKLDYKYPKDITILPKTLHSGLSKNKYATFTTELYCWKKDAAAMLKYVKLLQSNKEWIALHKPTFKTAGSLDNDGNHWLLSAAQAGDVKAINDILNLKYKDETINPNRANTAGTNALIKAIAFNQIAAADCLLNHKTNSVLPDQVDSHKRTPLLLATYLNRNDIVKLLLAKKVNIDHQDEDGDTPLFIAVGANNSELVSMLLTAKANPNITNHQGGFPLFYAAQEGYTKIVEELLVHNVDVNFKYNTPIEDALELAENRGCLDQMKQYISQHQTGANEISMTAYDIAVIMNHPEIAQMIDTQKHLQPSSAKHYT